MKNRLLENDFIEKDGIFIREFKGGYAIQDEVSLEFEIFRDVVVAKAYIFEKDNEWFLNLYKMNPRKGSFEKEYDSLCVQEIEKHGDFFELLLRSIYIDLDNEK